MLAFLLFVSAEARLWDWIGREPRKVDCQSYKNYLNFPKSRSSVRVDYSCNLIHVILMQEKLYQA